MTPRPLPQQSDRRPLTSIPSEQLHALHAIESIILKLNDNLRIPLEALTETAFRELSERDYEDARAMTGTQEPQR